MPDTDHMEPRKAARLARLRKQVEERFNAAKFDDGTPMMSDKLPPGIPPVRFESDGECRIETEPDAKPTASGTIPLSADQLAE